MTMIQQAIHSKAVSSAMMSFNTRSSIRRLEFVMGSQSRAYARSMSTSSSPTTKISEWISIEKLEENNNDYSGIAKLIMSRPPANSLSMEFLQDISAAVTTLEKDDDTETIILTSGLPNGIFSAGLDLSELYDPSFDDRLPQFWNAFQQLYIDLYGSRLSTVAAIDGHAPAAGCMLAISCDYRIMTSTSKCMIGLNESQLGIVAPPWLCQQYIDTIGMRQSELALLLGTLFSPQQALQLGLVDQLVDPHPEGSNENLDGDDKMTTSTVVKAAIDKAVEFQKIPSMARIAAKKVTRGPHIDKLIQNRQDDSDYFCSYIATPSVQKSLGLYLDQLSKRKK